MTTLARSIDNNVARPVRRRRSSRLLLLAAVLAVLGALLGAYVYRAAVDREGVVALARPIGIGTVVQATDFREVALPPDSGLATVAWGDLDRVVGLATAVDLRAGQILTRDSLTGEPSPAPGEAIVGLSVKAGRVPSTTLSKRDAVLVITGGGAPPRRAEIERAGDPDVSGRRSVDVVVPQIYAEELALASVEDRVAIVLVGRG